MGARSQRDHASDRQSPQKFKLAPLGAKKIDPITQTADARGHELFKGGIPWVGGWACVLFKLLFLFGSFDNLPLK